MCAIKDPKSGDYTFMFECPMCGRGYRDGQHVYEGRTIGPWQIRICQTCHVMNWDGIVESHQPRLMEHLAKIGVKVDYNESGFIKWPSGYEPPPPTPRQPRHRRMR